MINKKGGQKRVVNKNRKE